VSNFWFARLYDPLMAPIELLSLRRARRQLVADVAGLVLEIGAGTGLNFPHYRDAEQVIAIEPEAEMLRRARIRARHAEVPVRLVLADARRLPFPDGIFDAVIGTCVFCTIPDPALAFAELYRVLKPGGEVRILEHVRAASSRVAHLQDHLTPAWSRVAGGCCLNRPTLATARQAGFIPEIEGTRFGGVVVRGRLRKLSSPR
jgi:ubiquinone/menaquinone biosynthesis C-methylase UbiE